MTPNPTGVWLSLKTLQPVAKSSTSPKQPVEIGAATVDKFCPSRARLRLGDHESSRLTSSVLADTAGILPVSLLGRELNRNRQPPSTNAASLHAPKGMYASRPSPNHSLPSHPPLSPTAISACSVPTAEPITFDPCLSAWQVSNHVYSFV